VRSVALTTQTPCGHFSKGHAGYNIGNVQQFFKKYLQSVLAARILQVDFVVCTLAVRKKIRAGFDLSDRTLPEKYNSDLLKCCVGAC
jgi:hypothetical protein